jgi:hypothetical protein
MNQPKTLINHLENIKELYRKHMVNVNKTTKEMFKNKHVLYKCNTGEIDDDLNIIYETKEARIVDTTITSDHDIMFEIIDREDNLDIIFSFNILEIKER